MVGASLGNFSIVTNDILPALQNQNMWCFRAKNNVGQNFLNFALRKLVRDNLHGASGSARQFFQKGVFYEIPILYPPLEKINEFDAIVGNHFNKIELNRSQLTALQSLRDTLLPKLMSGEIRVQYDNVRANGRSPLRDTSPDGIGRSPVQPPLRESTILQDG